MRIIINIKDSAGISRIDELERELNAMKKSPSPLKYSDVIESVDKEWCD